jgi:hypothetical protein
MFLLLPCDVLVQIWPAWILSCRAGRVAHGCSGWDWAQSDHGLGRLVLQGHRLMPPDPSRYASVIIKAVVLEDRLGYQGIISHARIVSRSLTSSGCPTKYLERLMRRCQFIACCVHVYVAMSTSKPCMLWMWAGWLANSIVFLASGAAAQHDFILGGAHWAPRLSF